MRYQLPRTLVPSNRKFHQGFIAIFGNIVVLSVFMIMFGATSTTAQTGQDERCSGYRGQAHGLCTAAVATDVLTGRNPGHVRQFGYELEWAMQGL